MAKKATRKAAKKTKIRSAVKSAKAAHPVKSAKPQPKKARQTKTATAKSGAMLPVAPPTGGGRLTFNHAMIYVKDVARALGFYHDLMGFKLIEDFRHEGKSVYARLSAPGGDGTIALHQAGPGASLVSEGVRLYFEVRELDDFCRKLQQKGFYLPQMPRMMPWGWRHVYINDPDGHEISLYWAGENRWKKSVMQAAREAAKG
jgi:catechol 2,3-dioxygenase-like lactoylglutathione lyase family enzyme